MIEHRPNVGSCTKLPIWNVRFHGKYRGVSSIGQCNTSCSLLAGVSKAKVFRGR
jgi:hypothetical protein